MAKKQKKPADHNSEPITSAVRDALHDHMRATGKNLNAIAKETGLTWPALNRLSQPGGLMSAAGLNKLADHFGLTVERARK